MRKSHQNTQHLDTSCRLTSSRFQVLLEKSIEKQEFSSFGLKKYLIKNLTSKYQNVDAFENKGKNLVC